MTNRENLIAALEGKRLEHVSLTVNEEFVTNDPKWGELLNQGLCLIPYTSVVREVTDGFERVVESENRPFLEAEKRVSDRGLSLIGARRSPMQTILVDYAGLEAFAFHLSEEYSGLFSLQEALEDQLVETCKIIAAGPGRYISLLENLTAETWGARRFSQYHLPVYKKIIPILHAGGKKVYTHFDGRLACLSGLISQTDIDGIESLTSPPEGDMSYEEARIAWPDKFFWANINVSYYDLPAEKLKNRVHELLHQASPDSCNMAFEISEVLPANWRESIPVVLDALKFK